MSATNDGEGTAPAALPTRWQVCVHEAAHAVYARGRALTVVEVTVEGIVALRNGIEPKVEGEFGACGHRGGEQRLDAPSKCVLSLVGLAAAHRAGWPKPLLPYGEFVRLAEESRPESDEGKVLHELNAADDPEGLYEAARAEAGAFVQEHWAEIVKLAESLMETDSLDEEAVELVFDPTWPEFREMLDEIRLADETAPWVLGGGDEVMF